MLLGKYSKMSCIWGVAAVLRTHFLGKHPRTGVDGSLAYCFLMKHNFWDFWNPRQVARMWQDTLHEDILFHFLRTKISLLLTNLSTYHFLQLHQYLYLHTLALLWTSSPLQFLPFIISIKLELNQERKKPKSKSHKPFLNRTYIIVRPIMKKVPEPQYI